MFRVSPGNLTSRREKNEKQRTGPAVEREKRTEQKDPPYRAAPCRKRARGVFYSPVSRRYESCNERGIIHRSSLPKFKVVRKRAVLSRETRREGGRDNFASAWDRPTTVCAALKRTPRDSARTAPAGAQEVDARFLSTEKLLLSRVPLVF